MPVATQAQCNSAGSHAEYKVTTNLIFPWMLHPFLLLVPAKSVLLYTPLGVEIFRKKQNKTKTLFLSRLVKFVKSETFLFMRGSA